MNFLDGQRIGAKQLRRNAFVNIGLHCSCTKKRFTQATESGIGVDLHPQHIGELSKTNGLDSGDFKSLASAAYFFCNDANIACVATRVSSVDQPALIGSHAEIRKLFGFESMLQVSRGSDRKHREAEASLVVKVAALKETVASQGEALAKRALL